MKIPTQQLINELKELDERIELVPNPNRPGLSNIKISGRDICPVPSEMMQDEHTMDYSYAFPNGMVGKHRTYQEAKDLATSIINRLKNPDFAAEFFEIG